MERKLHVLIAGGGLSGLCLAHGLRKAGHAVDVFERDADLSRKAGYLLHVNGDGGEGLRKCLPEDLYELYLETSRKTPERRQSIVLTDQLDEVSAMPHLGPPNEGPRPHTAVHRRALRQILLARLGESFHAGTPVVGYEEDVDGVTLQLEDGSSARGDVLVAADGIRSAIRRKRLPEVEVIDAGIEGIGVFGRSPLSPEVVADLPPLLLQGVHHRGRPPRPPPAPRRLPAAPPRGRGARGHRARRHARPGRRLPDGQLQRRRGHRRARCSRLDARHRADAARQHAAGARGLAPGRARHRRAPRPGLDVRDPVRLPGPARAMGVIARDAHRRRRPRHAALARHGRQPRPARCRPAASGAWSRSAKASRSSCRPSAPSRTTCARYVYPFMRMAVEHDKHFGGGGLQQLRDPAEA